MIDPSPPPRPRRAAPFLSGFFLGALLCAVGAAAALFALHRQMSTAFERALRRFVFTEPTRAGFAAADLNLWRGRATLRELWAVGSGETRLTVDAVAVAAPLADLFSDRPAAATVRLTRPALRWSPIVEGDGGLRAPTFPGVVRSWTVEDGSATLAVGGAGLTLDRWGLSLVRAGPGEDGRSEQILEGSGRLLPEDPGEGTLRLVFAEPFSPARIDGEVALRDVSLPALYRLWGSDPDLRILSGRLHVRTQFNVRDDQLTASHFVEIRGLRVDPGRRKKLFGLSVRRLRDVLDIESLTFVVPVSGSVRDPQIGFAASLEQILTKVLENKTDDPEELKSWARRGGQYFGAKADAAWRRWLARRRGPG